MRGLIINEPWIGLILAGTKTWEMRAKPILLREEIALIRKGSKTVVGVAQVVDCLPAIVTLAAYEAAEPFHGIAAHMQRSAFDRGWRRPWVLRGVRALATPVSYLPKPGQVDWVSLDTEAQDIIASS